MGLSLVSSLVSATTLEAHTWSAHLMRLRPVVFLLDVSSILCNGMVKDLCILHAMVLVMPPGIMQYLRIFPSDS
jgi:hypothetical protein